MKQKSIRHLTHYVVLLTIMFIGLIIVTSLGKDIWRQSIVIAVMSLMFVLWGVIHHTIEKDLYWEVFLEYLLFGLLGTAGAVGLIFYL